MRYEYRVEVFKESAASSILLGSANTRSELLTKKLNELGRNGWKLISIEREIQRLWLFWTREAMVAVLIREAVK